MPVWDSDQYLKFQKERTQPAIDLASRVEIKNPKEIIDVGCGPGNSTAVIAKRWPEAQISGFDSSHAMLKTAKNSVPKVHWFQADVATWQPEVCYDLIFSNAVFQWVPDHNKLFSRLISFLKPGGALAVQLPTHYASPLHQSVLELSTSSQWKQATKIARQTVATESREFYYNLLVPLVSHVEIWETDYIHVLESVEAILEWFRGTGLRPYLEALANDQQRAQFEQELLDRYRPAYPPQQNGKVLFPFRRLFIIAYR
ncbi:trans-aconitate 2-methyltransferase [Gimesia aquarii]|uniref:Trans-aconitate 2-methyltransferase n=1 Tax=Gimesia aquarii TaxID=2527964 RepID=A0A517VX96_9PLAN|nr:trans-aconitate 2-methyltransferase [Gimesia aquarii]QDT97620.1 Trans-aconitate 2-methyltransferase [Gimesia aquarii]